MTQQEKSELTKKFAERVKDVANYDTAKADLIDRVLAVTAKNTPFLDRSDLNELILDKIESLDIRYYGCAEGETMSVAAQLRKNVHTIRYAVLHEWALRLDLERRLTGR